MKKPPLSVLYGAVLVDMMGFGIVLPLLPFYAESMGASPVQITLMVASFSAMQLAAAPLWGRVSDRRGRRPLLIAGLFASAVSYLLFGLANSIWLLFVSRLAAGAAGGTISVAHAYIADATTADDRARGMGHIGAASGLGVMVGPIIGGLFSEWGLGVPGFIAAALCALNGIAAIFWLPESRPIHARTDLHDAEAATLGGWLRSMTRFPMSLLLAIYFLTISSFNALTAVLALFMNRAYGTQAAEMSLVFTIAGGTTVLVRGVLIGWLVSRIGEKGAVGVGIVSLAFALTALPVLPNEFSAYLLATVYALGAGTLFPALASLVSRATDSGSQGAVLGGSQVVGGLGRVIGPLWAGWLFQESGINSPFVVGALCVGVAGLLAFRIPARVAAPARPVVVQPAQEAVPSGD